VELNIIYRQSTKYIKYETGTQQTEHCNIINTTIILLQFKKIKIFEA